MLSDAPSVESVQSITGATSSHYEQFFLWVYHPLQPHLATVTMRSAEEGGLRYQRAGNGTHITHSSPEP